MDEQQLTTAEGEAPDDRAPDPSVITGRRLGLAIAAGLVSAIAVPGYSPGLGLTLAGVVAAGVVVASRPAATRRDPWRIALSVVAVAAVVLPAVSDAGWMVGWSLLAGTGLAVLAVGGGTTWRGLVRAPFALLPAGWRVAPVVGREVRRTLPSGPRVGSAVRTLLLTATLLGVFGALFVSADRVFGSLVSQYLIPDLDVTLVPARLLLLATVTLGVATLVHLRADPDRDVLPPPPTRYLHGAEWQVPLGGLVALFAGFVTVQFSVLFGGHDWVQDTAGVTYASHVHEGFAQLVVVAALTLGVVAAAARYALPAGPREQRVRQALLAALCLLTLVVLVSAMSRLRIYEEAFGSTRLRLSAQAIICWLAAVFLLVLVAGAVRRTAWLPRGIVLASGIAVVLFGYLHPDAIIARVNVERFEDQQVLDLDYLGGLSADAVPALLALPAELRGCVLGLDDGWMAHDATGGWGALNLSRARASSLVAEHGAAPCRGAVVVDVHRPSRSYP